MWQSFEKSIRLSQIEQILPMFIAYALRKFAIEGVACQLPSSFIGMLIKKKPVHPNKSLALFILSGLVKEQLT